jgi:transcriptional regulator with XRE-family HTH domain
MLGSVTPAYDEILAANIRAARARLRVSQASVARRMTALGYRWTRQTVSQTEAAARRPLGAELFALSYCLEIPVPFLMLSAPEFSRRAEFPAGYVVDLPHTIQVQPGAVPLSEFWADGGDVPSITPEESQKAAAEAAG